MFMQNRFRMLARALAAVLCVTAMGTGAAADVPGLDLTGQDRSVRPGDDFFRYANGADQDRTVIPADRASFGPQEVIAERLEAQLRAILDEAASKTAEPATIEGRVGTFYRSFLDEQQVERLGAGPLQRDLADVAAARTRTDLAALMGTQNASFHGSIFHLSISPDAKQPARYAVQIGQGGLGLPDRDYYTDAKFGSVKTAYVQYAERLLTQIGWPDSKRQAAAIVAFETRLARASWSRTQQRDPDLLYNPMSVAALTQIAPSFAWGAFLQRGGIAEDRVIVTEKSAIVALAKIYEATPIETLRAWAAFQLADHAAPYLSRGFADAYFVFRDQTVFGQTEQAPRWRRAIRAVAGGHFFLPDRTQVFGNLGWDVGKLYVARHFPPDAKAKMQLLTTQLMDAFRRRTEASDWMSQSTKREALRKLDTFQIKVGYPDRWQDQSKVVTQDGDLCGNVLRAAADNWAFRVGRLHAPVDRSEWLLTPQTIDAYAGGLNDLVFPAAFLQPPYFDPAADPAVNFGAAVAIIGHELTHGFDDQGRKFDADGKLRDWWAPADSRKFEARAAKLGAQFSTYEPLPGHRINGRQTMGENIADLGGVSLALDAYRASLGGVAAPVIDGLTGEQRLFLSWAQVWRGRDRDDALKQQVASNTHSPRQFRVNGIVRNIDAWYDAFGIRPGDRLYLAPSQRVRIW
jgi:putative endopeptidase